MTPTKNLQTLADRLWDEFKDVQDPLIRLNVTNGPAMLGRIMLIGQDFIKLSTGSGGLIHTVNLANVVSYRDVTGSESHQLKYTEETTNA